MNGQCAGCNQLIYSAVPVVSIGQTKGSEQVAFRNLVPSVLTPWGVETFMQEEVEVLSAIERGAISSHGMLMINMSPQSILRCDEELLARAAEKQTLLLNVKTDPVPLDYLEKIGRVLKQWRGSYGLKIAMDGLHESNFPLQRMEQFDPDYLRIPAVTACDYLQAGPVTRAESMVRKLAALTVFAARNEGIHVIVSGVSTEQDQRNAATLGASHVEGGFVSARYAEVSYCFELEHTVMPNGCGAIGSAACDSVKITRG